MQNSLFSLYFKTNSKVLVIEHTKKSFKNIDSFMIMSIMEKHIHTRGLMKLLKIFMRKEKNKFMKKITG